MARVILNNITKIFAGNVFAVKNVNLEIEDGEFIVLVGPSGCGKSTTLRMIAGLEEINDGTISIDNRIVNDVPPKNRDIAMVFQNYALYPHMIVYNNMAFGLKLRKFSKSEIDARVRQAAEMLELTDLLHRKPKELSGGQRQRVALGRAIVRNPKAFLLDEPLSNLDAKLRMEMRAELKKLHYKLKTTTIYVTHDQMEAMTLGNRIVVMKNGEIHQVDKPLEVYDRPVNKFVAAFIGTPPMNFIDGIIDSNGVFISGKCSIILPDNIKKKANKYAGNKMTLGIRPEDIIILYEKNADIKKEIIIKAKVMVVEPLGHEQILYLKLQEIDNTIIGKVDSHQKVEVEDQIEILLRKDKIHLFDNESDGKNVTIDKS